jgi:hypothetical protein
MKIGLIGSTDYNRHQWPGAHFNKRMRQFPGIVYECYSPESFEQYLPTVDVIMLNNPIIKLPVDQVSLINSYKKFTVQIQLDPWKSIYNSYTHLDSIITAANSYLKSSVKHFSNRFWSPACADILELDLPRDIDIIMWGNSNRKYPFRSFMFYTLRALSIGCKDICTGIKQYTITLNNKNYTLLHISGVARYFSKYYSILLYEYLNRSKISLSGTHHVKIPLSKHFENAACGTLNIGNEFTDKESLGFEHGKNIWFTDKDKFLNDIQFLLENPNTVNEITYNAKELIKSRHTIAIRAKELYDYFYLNTGVE